MTTPHFLFGFTAAPAVELTESAAEQRAVEPANTTAAQYLAIEQTHSYTWPALTPLRELPSSADLADLADLAVSNQRRAEQRPQPTPEPCVPVTGTQKSIADLADLVPVEDVDAGLCSVTAAWWPAAGRRPAGGRSTEREVSVLSTTPPHHRRAALRYPCRVRALADCSTDRAVPPCTARSAARGCCQCCCCCCCASAAAAAHSARRLLCCCAAVLRCCGRRRRRGDCGGGG